MTAEHRVWPGWAAVLDDAFQDERRLFHRADLADEARTGWERVEVMEQEHRDAYAPTLRIGVQR